MVVNNVKNVENHDELMLKTEFLIFHKLLIYSYLLFLMLKMLKMFSIMN